MGNKTAILTGITGQTASYMAELLLSKGYYVVGLKRRSSLINTSRIDHLYNNTNFKLLYWDSDDSLSLIRYVYEYEPSELYHFSAQSHVKVSFDIPEHTFNTTAVGALKILETIRSARNKIKMYNACSSEMFGAAPPPQNENTPFDPQSPYACGKVASYYLTRNYRKAYDMFICNGILFNHESERRGETFVTRKITMAAANIKKGKQSCLHLGNLYSKRDWGYAPDYCEAIYAMMQQKEPDDYVIATGESHSVKEFCSIAFEEVGLPLEWRLNIDKTDNACGHDASGRELVKVSEKYFRPTEVDFLCGDASKAEVKLGWKPKHSFRDIVRKMVESDLKNA